MTRVAKWSSWRWCGGDGGSGGGFDCRCVDVKTDGGWRGGEDDAAGGDVVTMVWWYGGMEMVVDRSWVAGGCDPLALVDGFTPVEGNIGLLETRFHEEDIFMFVFPKDVTGS
ncbi:hypothetical protein Tco_0237673 [Tanacetum coccineum]